MKNQKELQDKYIKNINTIDFILKEDKPTKEQVIFVLALTDSDTKYEQYFYDCSF